MTDSQERNGDGGRRGVMMANLVLDAVSSARDRAEARARLAAALNEGMAHALGAQSGDAALAAIGAAIEETGLHLHINLWDEARSYLAPTYNSLSPELYGAITAIAGLPALNKPMPARSIEEIAAAPVHLREYMDVLQRRYPDAPLDALRRLAALLDSPQVAVAPLRAAGRTLGICAVLGHLRPDDLTMIQVWADAIAGLIMQHRLLAAAAEQARRHAALAALTVDLARAGEPRAVLERAVDAASELLSAHSVAAFLPRNDGRGFDAVASRGLASLAPGAPALAWEGTIAGRAMRANAVQAVADVAVERAAGTSFPRLAGDVSVGALLVAPIAEGQDAPSGVLEVYTAAPRAWSADDSALLSALAAACAVSLRGARERERARREAARASALAELSATIHAADDPDTVLRLLVHGICTALGASRSWLLWRAGPTSPIVVSHEYALPGVRLASELIDAAQWRVWASMDAQTAPVQPIVVDDIREQEDLRARWASVAAEQRPYALLAAPLIEEGRLRGILGVHQCGSPRHWEPEEVVFVRGCAAQAGIALRQRRLLAATREDARRLTVLNHMAEAVIGAPSFGAMCDRTLAAAVEVLGATMGSIHVYDETAAPDRVLRMVSWLGLADDLAATWETLPLEQGMVGLAAARRHIMLTSRLDETPPEAAATLAVTRQAGIEARAAVPMLARGRLLGVLTIAFQTAHDWTATDRILLQTVANQLAAALEAEHLRGAAAAAAAAREADRLKSELLATVSHELRTPLGAIKGFASALRYHGDRLPPDERVESARLIDEAADRLTELVDNLLDLQRLEAGRLPIIRARLDLATLVAQVLAEMAPHAPRHQLTLDAPPRPLPMRGDARRLRQVVQNLVENAVKYSPAGGPVALSLRGRRGGVELRVTDLGIGLSPDQLEPIFARFHRLDNSTTRRVGGTGLGLAIVRGLVAAHGGTIHAESAGDGEGATFVVFLPRAPKTEAMHAT